LNGRFGKRIDRGGLRVVDHPLARLLGVSMHGQSVSRVRDDLEVLVNACLAEPVVRQTFVHRRDGQRYSYDGVATMFRRYVGKCGLADFGLYDLKSKAATDMFRAGVSLERVQQLLGHKSVRTTEIYIKSRLPDLVQPTTRPMTRKPDAKLAG
jgi:site-specific recombinase XerD